MVRSTSTRGRAGVATRAGIALCAVAIVATILATVGAQLTAHAAPATVLVNETFQNATVADPLIVGAGNTCLTGATASTATLAACPTSGQGGPVPPRGVTPGYLQLTDATTNRAGALFYNRPIPATAGIEATFELYEYGGTGADGVTFFLVDGATQLTATGGLGGSLGYAQRNGTENGILGGYVGIGFDVYGNFYDDGEQRGTGCPPGQQSPSTQSGSIAPNTVVVRGSGSALQGYCYQRSTTNPASNPNKPTSTLPARLAGTTLADAKRTVDIVITPAPNPQITVRIDFNDGKGFQSVLTGPAPAGTPSTYKFGFSGSTGGSTDVHLLRNIVVGTVNPLDALNLVKQVDRTTPLPPVLHDGDTIPYQFVVTNAGAETLSNVNVTDPLVPAITCPATTLPPEPDPNGTIVCTGRHTVMAADVTAGQVANTATAHGVTPASAAVDSPPASVTVPLVSSLSLTKTPSAGPYTVGGTVTFTYMVTNTGGSVLSNVAVTDNKVRTVTCPVTTLAPRASVTCTGPYTVKQSDMAANGTITNTARATGTSPIGQTAPSPDATATIPIGVDLGVTKTVDNSTPTVGQNVTYTMTVVNHGPSGATGIVISAPVPPGATNLSATASAGSFDAAAGTWTIPALAVNASATLTEVDRIDTSSTVVNSATVTTRVQPEINPTNDSASQTVNPVVPTTDIAVLKDLAPAEIRVGQQAVATVTATNNGPFPATGVMVRDPIPSGLAYVSATGPGSYDAGTGVWSVGDLAVGQSAVLTMTVAGTAPGFVINTASLFAVSPTDINAANDVATAPTTVDPPLADLSVTKISRQPSVLVGATVNFVVTATNNGPDSAPGPIVNDVLPAGLTLVSATPEQGAYDPVSGAWTVGALAAGTSVRMEIVTTASAIGFQSNLATITDAAVTDPDGTNNSASAGTQVAPLPPPPVDVGVTKVADIANPTASGAAVRGGTVTFTLTATNSGPNPASGVVFTDALPAGLDFVSTNGPYDPVTGRWTIGNLAVGATRTLLVTATVSGGPGTYVNVVGLTNVDQTDTNSQNDTASDSVQVEAVADLAVTKTVAPTTAKLGDTVTYHVTVTNNGPNDDTGVQLVETSKEAAVFTRIVLSKGTFDPLTRIWTIGDLANGETASIDVDVLVDHPAFVVNKTVVFSADLPDPDLDNNEASATLSVPGADLAITKTVDHTTAAQGAPVTFTVAVVNNGPDAAQSATVDDVLPSGLAYVSSSPSIGTYNAANGVWSIGTMNAGDTATLTVATTLTGSSTVTNTATVSAAEPPDQTPANSTASVAVSPVVTPTPPTPPTPTQSADLSLAKTVDAVMAQPGQALTYTLTVTNAGPDAADAVVIADSLPAGLAFVAPPAGCQVSGATVTCPIGSLPPGGRASVALTATFNSAVGVTNVATVASNTADPTPANNSASARVDPAGTLPPTGRDTPLALVAGLGLLAVGATLASGTGRRRGRGARRRGRAR